MRIVDSCQYIGMDEAWYHATTHKFDTIASLHEFVNSNVEANPCIRFVSDVVQEQADGTTTETTEETRISDNAALRQAVRGNLHTVSRGKRTVAERMDKPPLLQWDRSGAIQRRGVWRNDTASKQLECRVVLRHERVPC